MLGPGKSGTGSYKHTYCLAHADPHDMMYTCIKLEYFEANCSTWAMVICYIHS